MARVMEPATKSTARRHADFWRITRGLVSVEIPVRAINAAMTILLIRLLPMAEYGIYAYFLSIATVAVAVISSGVQVVYVRRQAFLAAKGEKDGTLFAVSLLIILGMHAAACVIVLPLMGGGWAMIAAMAYATSLSVVSLMLAHFQATLDLRQYAIENVARNLMSVLSIVVLALLHKLTALNVLWWLTIGHAILFASAARRMREFVAGARLRSSVVKSLLAENGYLVVYYAIVGVYGQVDLLILKHFADAGKLAIYGAALRYQSLILVLLPPLVNAIRVYTASPTIAGSSEAERRYFSEWRRKVLKAGIPVLLLGEVLTPWLLPLVSGASYAPAVPVFQCLLLSAFVLYLFAPANSLIIGRSGYPVLAITGAIGLGCRSAGGWLAASRGSVVGIAISAVVATLVLNLIPVGYLKTVLWRADARS
jgi:O-antigen/teichoic acid export membrane protein